MNIPKAAHSMRIIALPLARVKASRDAKVKPFPSLDAKTMLVYYHFDLISPFGGRENHSLGWHRKMLNSVMSKATDIWTGLGKAPKGSWKLQTYELGERIANRIDFEEVALRNVEPSLGPQVGTSSRAISVGENKNRSYSLPKIPLVYPPSLYLAREERALHPALAHLKSLLASRGPQHRRGFYLWMLIAPLTAPIILIPLIPNLPFFFCAWRSWSHYRAYRSSQYLSALLDHGLIEPHPSLELDQLYASFASSARITRNLSSSAPASGSSGEQSITGNGSADGKPQAASGRDTSQSEFLLAHKAIPLILEAFYLPESTITDIYRALDQARGRLGISPSSGPS